MMKRKATKDDMPSTLPEEMRPEFNELVAHIRARDGFVKEEDLGLIETLMIHRFIIREAFDNVKEHGAIIDGKSNPAAAMITLQSNCVGRVAGLLNIGPLARSRLKSPAPIGKGASPWGKAA